MLRSGMGLHWCPMSLRTVVWTKPSCSGDPEELICPQVLFFFPGEYMQNRDNLAHLPESRWHLQTLSVYQMLFFRSSVPG